MLSPNKDVSEQAVWALGNIAGDSSEHRDMVLSSDVLTNLRHLRDHCICALNSSVKNTFGNDLTREQIKLLLQDSNCLPLIDLLRRISWTSRNLYRGTPQPDSKYIKDTIEMSNEMLKIPDTDTIQEAAWGFGFLTDGDEEKEFSEKIRLIKECGALKRLVECLDHFEYRVRHPALRTLGNIVARSDEGTQDVLDMGICDKLLPLLDLKQYILKLHGPGTGTLLKETCWVISNITAGTAEQIDCIIKSNVFPILINLVKKSPYEIRKEATWAINGATCGGSNRQVQYLAHKGVIPALISTLGRTESEILSIAMETLNNILKRGEEIKNARGNDENEFLIDFEMQGGLDIVE